MIAVGMIATYLDTKRFISDSYDTFLVGLQLIYEIINKIKVKISLNSPEMSNL